MPTVSTMNIYRHFKGGYYIVQSLASIESTGEEVVIYQSLQDGRVWVRPVSSFQELVPEGKENPTGQKYRFEKVVNYNNQLKMISTDVLVKELLSRTDCPTEISTADPDKIWREEYLVGIFEERFVHSELTVTDFNTFNVYSDLNRAVDFMMRNPGTSILKKVLMKQDFD